MKFDLLNQQLEAAIERFVVKNQRLSLRQKSIDKRELFVHLVTRTVEQRKNRYVIDVQLAQTLGVSQSTINAHEFVRRHVPVSALPLLACTLGVSMEELVDDTPSGARKRGPAPKLQQHLERITALPEPRQRAVMDVIEAMLAHLGAEETDSSG